jgi:hypothetical protein
MAGHRRARFLPAKVEPDASSMALVLALAFLAASGSSGCGKSTDEQAAARRLSMEKALAASRAEEREKDRRMRDAAAAEVSERIASEAAEHDRDLAQIALAGAVVTPQQQEAERADALRKYTDKLRQALNDPASVQMRSAELSPKLKGMCAEFNSKTKAGAYAGFKRAVVTDLQVAVEEPPTRELMTQFLVFQIAARDTGCFPDVQNVRILQ